METIPKEAISSQTFCTNCDETMCDCRFTFSLEPYPRYVIINDTPYRVV